MLRRQLNYRDWPNQPPREKGIDVSIAVDLMHLGHVEVACWSGFKPLRFPRTNLPYCHFLNERDGDAVVDDWHGRA